MSNIVDKNTPELVSFLKGCGDISDKYHNDNFATLKLPVFETNNGRRYIRVARVGVQTSVHCFVDRTNGDVLKAAGWKAPAKHTRGNIFDNRNGLGSMGEYGPAYLK